MGLDTKESQFQLRVRGGKIGSVSEWLARVEGLWDNIERIE